MNKTPINYIDSDGCPRTINECYIYQDKAERFWLWSEQLQSNLAYKSRSREDCLLAAIASLLFTIQLRDERINKLQKIADIAQLLADEIKPDEDCNHE